MLSHRLSLSAELEQLTSNVQVIICDPMYDAYASMCQRSGATPVPIRCPLSLLCKHVCMPVCLCFALSTALSMMPVLLLQAHLHAGTRKG